ncbi:MAG: ABC transporter substrate-binding protein [Deltaproteobacteria bacterium]|nr:ABC transporter substrate-binding protein [Deltaproteobacteria bacterium]
MRYCLLIAATCFLIVFETNPVSAQLKKVRFAVATIAISEVPFKVAQLKGFYREEGLDVETILIRGAVGVQALIGGSVDYSSSSGAVIAAGVRGLGLKLVLIVSSKPAFDLVSRPNIRSIDQLKGKIVGISSRGGAVDLLTQLILRQNGLTPDKDVTSLVVGSAEELMIALRAGLISAALLSPPRQFLLYREGFNQLAYSGDYLPTYPTGGIGATENKIKKEPEEVLAFVKGSLKGMNYYRQNRSESIDILAKFLGIKDPALAAQVYDLHASRLAKNGSADESWMRGAIEFTKRSLGVSKEIPPGQAFDFSFVQKAAR